MNQKELLLLGEEILKRAKIEDYYFKAKELLNFILEQENEQFIIHNLEPVSVEDKTMYETRLQELIKGKPLQYITNKQEFMGLTFYVDENVLIPQPDTEILVETTIKAIQEKEETINILDLCTGSGAIGISLAKYIKNAKITLSDISIKALEIAKKNAKNNQVEEKIEFVCSNMFENISKKEFEYIVSNPPYIKTCVISSLPEEVKQEPHIALDGGEDGLEFYKTIIENASSYLKQNGYLLIEIGYDQAELVINLWKNKPNDLQLITQKPIKDLGGNNRVLVFQKK